MGKKLTSSPVFILRTIAPNPNMNVVIQGILSFLLIRFHDNIRITRVKGSILFFWPRYDLELFNAPYLEARPFSDSLPGGFPTGGGLLDFVIQITPNQGQVGIFPRNTFRFHHLFSYCCFCNTFLEKQMCDKWRNRLSWLDWFVGKTVRCETERGKDRRRQLQARSNLFLEKSVMTTTATTGMNETRQLSKFSHAFRISCRVFHEVFHVACHLW